MPVGSHKDAFKAHQTVKKAAGKDTSAVLINMAADILLDFVKCQRQVKADRVPEKLPADKTLYDEPRLNEALDSVEKLCGKCEDSHDDGCFVNQTRRALIAAKTGVDLGTHFDGKKSLDDLIKEAERLALPDAVGQAVKTGFPLTPPSISSDPLRAPNEKELSDLRLEFKELKEKDIFRRTLIDEIMETISAVSQGDFAAEMPVHDDEQLGKLASAFNLMLKTVNQTMRNLDGLVAERSRDLRMIMNTVPTGLLSLNEDFKIKPEYSKACESILDLGDLRGRDFLDAIGFTRRRNDDRARLMEFLDIFRQKLLPEEDLIFLNPFPELEIKINGGAEAKWLRLHYHLIDLEEENTPHILVLMEDITKSKAMQGEIEESKKANLQLKAIAEDPDLFCEFLGESLKFLDQAERSADQIQEAVDPRPMVNEIFRNVHTIKGTAGAFALEDVAEQAMTLENTLSLLRNEKRILPETVEEMKGALAELTGSVNEAAENTKSLLGIDPLKEGVGFLRIDAKEIKKNIELVETMSIEPDLKSIIAESLKKLRSVPAGKGFAKALKIVPRLKEQLGKKIDFMFDDRLMIDCDLAQELNTPLVHLIRNAFDHGIESPEERTAVGKEETGRITLSAEVCGNQLVLNLSDDGRGLDPVKLRDKAVSKNILTPEDATALSGEEAYQIIFKPGFSTAEAVTDVSGRGVGMDAVWSKVCQDLGGKISISSEVGKGTSFIIAIPQQ